MVTNDIARDSDDISLVGLAALTKDSVVLAGLRESVVLYAFLQVLGIAPRREFEWRVDIDVADRARRFIDAFNALLDEQLPAPIAANVELYWRAGRNSDLLGRCTRLGYDNTASPVRYYHWAICAGPDYQLAVHEFWSTEIWTTVRYRGTLDSDGRRPDARSPTLGLSSATGGHCSQVRNAMKRLMRRLSSHRTRSD